MKKSFCLLVLGTLLALTGAFYGHSKLSVQNVDINQCVAGRGCCSGHSGVCGCVNGRSKCCDGTLSPSCHCYSDNAKGYKI